MSSKELLFCILDSEYSVASGNQHQTISTFCGQRGYSKGFYGTEDQSTIQSGLYLESKISTLDLKYGGIVIYSIYQYKACVNFYSLIKTLIRNGKVFCSASENIVLANEHQFDDFFEHATLSSISLDNRELCRTILTDKYSRVHSVLE